MTMCCCFQRSSAWVFFCIYLFFIISSKCILRVKQLDLLSHFTWKIRCSNCNLLGTNKKGTGNGKKETISAGLLKTFENDISVKKFYPRHLSISFTWCMSFVFLQSIQSCMCADFPRISQLWITKPNKNVMNSTKSLRVKPLHLSALFVFTL